MKSYDELRGSHITAHTIMRMVRDKCSLREAMAAKDVDTTAYAFGRACHVYILEGQFVFNNQYVVGGPLNEKTGKCYQRTSKKFKDLAAEQTVPAITTEEHNLILAMYSAVWENKPARQLLEDGVAEVTVRKEMFGLPCQSRLDWLVAGSRDGIVDLKTTVSIIGFQHQIEAYLYQYQAAFYQMMASGNDRKLPFYFIAVSKEEKPQVMVVKMDQGHLDYYAGEIKRIMESVKDEFFELMKEREEEPCQK